VEVHRSRSWTGPGPEEPNMMVSMGYGRATIADVTQGRFSVVPDNFISRFWDLAGGSIDAEFLPHQFQVTRKVGVETLVIQKASRRWAPVRC
jgi:hypothetical protein